MRVPNPAVIRVEDHDGFVEIPSTLHVSEKTEIRSVGALDGVDLPVRPLSRPREGEERDGRRTQRVDDFLVPFQLVDAEELALNAFVVVLFVIAAHGARDLTVGQVDFEIRPLGVVGGDGESEYGMKQKGKRQLRT